MYGGGLGREDKTVDPCAVHGTGVSWIVGSECIQPAIVALLSFRYVSGG